MGPKRVIRPRAAESVPGWPTVRALVRVDGTGTITITGTERPCASSSPDQLRLGIAARCAALAVDLGRPVRLTVTEGDQVLHLAVRPEGVVQELRSDGTIDPAGDLAPQVAACRQCGHHQPITTTTCPACTLHNPHQVEAADALATAAREPEPSRAPVPAPTALRLIFSTQAPVTVRQGAALGRAPLAIGGRLQVPVASPEHQMSLTHALVDLDDDGRILVTDHGSTNGTTLQTFPPRELPPGQACEVPPGTTLVLGDVLCTLETVVISGGV